MCMLGIVLLVVGFLPLLLICSWVVGFGFQTGKDKAIERYVLKHGMGDVVAHK